MIKCWSIVDQLRINIRSNDDQQLISRYFRYVFLPTVYQPILKILCWFVCLLFFRYTGMMTLWLTIDQLMINWCSTVDKLMINLWLTVSQLVINWWSTVDKLMINSWSADMKDMVVCFLFSSSNTQEWWSTVGRWMINYNRY